MKQARGARRDGGVSADRFPTSSRGTRRRALWARRPCSTPGPVGANPTRVISLETPRTSALGSRSSSTGAVGARTIVTLLSRGLRRRRGHVGGSSSIRRRSSRRRSFKGGAMVRRTASLTRPRWWLVFSILALITPTLFLGRRCGREDRVADEATTGDAMVARTASPTEPRWWLVFNLSALITLSLFLGAHHADALFLATLGP